MLVHLVPLRPDLDGGMSWLVATTTDRNEFPRLSWQTQHANSVEELLHKIEDMRKSRSDTDESMDIQTCACSHIGENVTCANRNSQEKRSAMIN